MVVETSASNPHALHCSVGIMTYNEEANIAKAMEAILEQRLTCGEIEEVLIVASGCTDHTAEIVEAIAQKDARVRLIVQERRLGKASAINLFVGAASGSVLLMVSADVLVKEGTIDALLRHFQDPGVGMVGGHPIPVNDEMTFLGHAVHVLWRLHDRLARLSPKLGEIVAFRNVVPSIPSDTAVDEISIQALISQLGYRLVYEPDAVVYNHGPTTIEDFLRQRRRIYAGHLKVHRQQGYAASTMSLRRIGRALAGSGCFATPRSALWTMGAIGLEVVSRGLGHYDYVRHRSHHVWETAITTKRPIAPAANAHSEQSVLVFNIVNFHRLELEHGLRAGRQLTQRIIQQVKLAVGPAADVSIQRSGTIVVLLPADRDGAENAARLVVDSVHTNRQLLTGSREGVSVKLACGIIAFSQSGRALAESIPVSVSADIQPVMAN